MVSIDKKCGGVLIEQNLVFTAAHCVDKENDIRRKAGVFLLNKSTRKVEEKFFSIKKIHLHNLYQKTKKYVLHYDYAILEIEKIDDARFEYQTIALADRSFIESDYQTARFYGRGHNGKGQQTDELRTISMKLISKEKAQKHRKVASHRRSQVYAWNTDTRNICNGDSGGPLVVHLADSTPLLVGLASITASTCKTLPLPKVVSVFARVNTVLPWIESVKRISK